MQAILGLFYLYFHNEKQLTENNLPMTVLNREHFVLEAAALPLCHKSLVYFRHDVKHIEKNCSSKFFLTSSKLIFLQRRDEEMKGKRTSTAKNVDFFCQHICTQP